MDEKKHRDDDNDDDFLLRQKAKKPEIRGDEERIFTQARWTSIYH